MGKVGGVLLSLFVALVFGGVGVFASWAIGSTLQEAHRARDWVRVKAIVDQAALRTGGSDGTTYQAEGAYRYVFQGRQYAGSRLGISKVGGSDNIDDWHREVNARLEDARAAGQPVTVWVNPDNPSESVFDRDIRWSEIVFFVPFALAFGGVGVGALVAMVFVLRGKKEEGGAKPAMQEAMRGQAASSDAQGHAGMGFLWVFAFFWNAISFPIAFLFVPQIVESGEWAGLLVLLFPLVGVGLLWSAVSTTIAALRARFGGPAPTPRAPGVRPTAPGRFAAQAARAMFDPKGGAASRSSRRREVAIPASVAEVEESGGTLVIRYSRRRKLGLAFIVFLIGAILAFIGVAMAADEGIGIAAVALVLIGTLMDLWGVSMLIGTLEVRIQGGELAVDKRGLLGSRSWRLRREAVSAIRANVSYTVNDLPYFSLFAEAQGERVPLGDSLKGPELADTVAQRIARALDVPPALVVPADPNASPSVS